MDQKCFTILSHLLRTTAGLKSVEIVNVKEMVAVFLHILAHDVKNRVVQREFLRSGKTISWHFNIVLLAVVHFHDVLLKKPQSVSTVAQIPDGGGSRFSFYKRSWYIIQRLSIAFCWFTVLYTLWNCLGAFDGTHIKVNMMASDRPRYRTRKGEVATNVLGVCDMKVAFVFVLAGWEGSAVDSHILRDAISRLNSLKVSKGNYVHMFLSSII